MDRCIALLLLVAAIQLCWTHAETLNDNTVVCPRKGEPTSPYNEGVCRGNLFYNFPNTPSNEVNQNINDWDWTWKFTFVLGLADGAKFIAETMSDDYVVGEPVTVLLVDNVGEQEEVNGESCRIQIGDAFCQKCTVCSGVGGDGSQQDQQPSFSADCSNVQIDVLMGKAIPCTSITPFLLPYDLVDFGNGPVEDPAPPIWPSPAPVDNDIPTGIPQKKDAPPPKCGSLSSTSGYGGTAAKAKDCSSRLLFTDGGSGSSRRRRIKGL